MWVHVPQHTHTEVRGQLRGLCFPCHLLVGLELNSYHQAHTVSAVKLSCLAGLPFLLLIADFSLSKNMEVYLKICSKIERTKDLCCRDLAFNS